VAGEEDESVIQWLVDEVYIEGMHVYVIRNARQ